MAKITYKLSPFDATSASQGALCVMVSGGYPEAEGTTITNVDIIEGAEVKNANFFGAGICRKVNSQYLLVINSIAYTFNASGSGTSYNSRDYKLMIGEIADSISTVGNTVDTTTTGGTTRTNDGSSTTISDEAGQSVVDSLNARDHFAVQALKAMMEKVADPASLSNNEMNFYCQQAYQWAANMMTLAASSRASLDDETASTSTSTVAIGSLESNTEKLLNNLVAELACTDERSIATVEYWSKDGEEDTTIDPEDDSWTHHPATYGYSERMVNPTLNTILSAYVAHTPVSGEPASKTTVGLDDLIQAISSISVTATGGNATIDLTSLTAAITDLGTTRTANIGSSGLGRDNDHPLYISGGGFPTRDSLAAAFTGTEISDFLTFNSAKAVGYSSKAEVSNALYDSIKSRIDSRISAWLNALTAKVTISGTDYNVTLTVNTPTS